MLHEVILATDTIAKGENTVHNLSSERQLRYLGLRGTCVNHK